MSESNGVRFAVKALPAAGARPNEMTRTMAPHPLVYQELPYDPEFLLYNHRLTAMRLSSATPDEAYWRVRRQVILRHTGELPLEVRGPDAARMLDRVFTRDVTRVAVGRCSYQFACYDDGGMITDGVLMRLGHDRFWFGQADGDLLSWLKASARGFEVEVHDPGVWISQVQEPDALKVLAAAVDGDYPERFRYLDIATVRIAGQPVIRGSPTSSARRRWKRPTGAGAPGVCAFPGRSPDSGTPCAATGRRTVACARAPGRPSSAAVWPSFVSTIRTSARAPPSTWSAMTV